MAHGTDSEEFRLVSAARSGLKREFAFAIKNQSNLRTRRGRLSQSSPDIDGASEYSSPKRFKSAVVEEEMQIDLIDKEKNVQIDVIESSVDEKLEGGDAKLTCMEESKLDSVQSQVAEPPKTDSMQSVNADENGTKLIVVDEIREAEVKAEIPVVNELLEKTEKKPLRRFTRSLLKPNPEVVTAAASDGSTVPSEDACKNQAIASDDGGTSEAVSPQKPRSKYRMEIKMSKKVALRKFPTTVKDLLDTGLLDGLAVEYQLKNKKCLLRGTIKDAGILCFCDTCNGCEVVGAYQFEKHAGSAQKHPSNNIYLENGKSLRDVTIACRGASSETVEEVIKDAISSSTEAKFRICKNCKEPLSTSCTMKVSPYCESCLVSNETFASSSRLLASKARSSKAEASKSSGVASKRVTLHNKCKGKITRKDLRLHKLVFAEDGGLPDGTELAYYVRGQKKLEGYKKGFGIFCFHCESVVSPSQFEGHAGYASRRKPYLNIYTSNGVSLHELSISLKRSGVNHENDDLCGYCADFGDLLCCDLCPRAFHQDCVGLSSIPDDKWECPYCAAMNQRERSCAYNANALAAGRVSGVDPIEEITRRCIRIVETTETEVGGCALCRCHGFSTEGFGSSTVILCDQCEKEYHIGCLKDHKMADLKELPKGKWFCSTGCRRIHTALQKLVAKGSEKLPNVLLDVIKKKHEEKYPDDTAGLDVSWRLFSGKNATSESRSFLSKAVTIFHEQFDPILDAKTGSDFIAEMVYGRSVRDQEFGGMYCALLTVNSTVVSAGIFRVFGEMAEIPLVATSSASQGQGYFQSLFSCIERLFGFLEVKNIVLPSAEESKSIWTDKFGFKTVPRDLMNEYRNKCPMMIFQGTSLLEKPVPKFRIVP